MRGQPCNTANLGINQKFAPEKNLNIRLAMAYALNKPAYIKAFYGGQAEVADNWMPLDTQYAIPLGLPTYDPAKAKAEIVQSGLSGSQLTIELWYPSDFSRGYMPDAKGLFEAISNDLTAVGFTVVPHTSSVSTGGYFKTISSDAPAFLHGWGCDWAGADNYLQSWIGGGRLTSQFGWSDPNVLAAVTSALAATTSDEAKQFWETAQKGFAADMPTIPLLHASPTGAAKTYVKGFVGTGALVEFYNSVWLTSRLALTSSTSPGRAPAPANT